MPGVGCELQQTLVSIYSVDHLAVVLPTKTKPKKLVFVGSNRKRFVILIFFVWIELL